MQCSYGNVKKKKKGLERSQDRYLKIWQKHKPWNKTHRNNNPLYVQPWFIKCLSPWAPARYTKCRARTINLLLFIFFQGCNFVLQKKFNAKNNKKNIISLTFLCIVPSTWKNIGGVQEKLGSELTPRVDKSSVLLRHACVLFHFSQVLLCVSGDLLLRLT